MSASVHHFAGLVLALLSVPAFRSEVFDAMGTRGWVTATLLEELAQQDPEPLAALAA